MPVTAHPNVAALPLHTKNEWPFKIVEYKSLLFKRIKYARTN
jgi:hypothetical protein